MEVRRDCVNFAQSFSITSGAWMRRSGVGQFCTAYLYLHGRRGREVPFFRTRHKHIPVGSGATSMSLTVRK